MNVNRKTSIRRRGMVYAMVLLTLLIILSILLLGTMKPGVQRGGGGLMANNDNNMKMTSASQNSTIAFNLAESGVEYTLEWMHSLSAPPSNTVAFAPAIWNSTSTGTPARSVVNVSWSNVANSHTYSGLYSVVIYPYASNAGATQKKYLIESKGTFNGASQIVDAYVEQGSFGDYAYFTNIDETDGYWVVGLNSFDGPMHSNNADGNATNFLWYSADTTSPIFKYTGANAYTTSAGTIAWSKDSIGNMSAPATTNDWAHIAAGGSGTVRTGVAQVPLPTSSSLQQVAALGGTSAPTGLTPKVVVPNALGAAQGGIYIHGPVDDMSLSTANNGVVQKIEIDQTDTTTTPSTSDKTYVTIDPTSNQTSYYTVSTQASTITTSPTTTLTGDTNGVVYSDSSIGTGPNDGYQDADVAWSHGDYSHGTNMTGGVHGVVADNYYNSAGALVHQSGLTVATAATSNMNIDGSITTNTQRAKDSSGNYITETQDSNYTTKAGTLGLVSDAIEVVDTDSSGNPITNIEVDGSVIAYDTFDACNMYYRSKGSFQVMGGYIAGKAGFFGVIDMSGNLLGGFAEHYNYDPRLADDPPPFFPTTGTNYNIASWQRAGNTIE